MRVTVFLSYILFSLASTALAKQVDPAEFDMSQAEINFHRAPDMIIIRTNMDDPSDISITTSSALEETLYINVDSRKNQEKQVILGKNFSDLEELEITWCSRCSTGFKIMANNTRVIYRDFNNSATSDTDSVDPETGKIVRYKYNYLRKVRTL